MRSLRASSVSVSMAAGGWFIGAESMSIPKDLRGPTETFEPASRRTDDAIWNAWIAKGRAGERRNTARRVQAVKFAATAVLLAVAAFWADLAQYAVVIRIIVAVSAVVVIFEQFHAKRYTIAALFGA